MSPLYISCHLLCSLHLVKIFQAPPTLWSSQEIVLIIWWKSQTRPCINIWKLRLLYGGNLKHQSRPYINIWKLRLSYGGNLLIMCINICVFLLCPKEQFHIHTVSTKKVSLLGNCYYFERCVWNQKEKFKFQIQG